MKAYLDKLRAIRPLYFLMAALVFGTVCVFALRANNQHMIRLRDAVYAADKNEGDVQGPLRNLQSYVTHHMNTSLVAGNTAVYPPIQLKYTYERLVQAQQAAFQAANSQLYSQAQALCEQQNPTDFSGRNRVPCITQYVTSHGAKQPAPIPDALYKFSFTSARWSPDLAGWSLVVTVLAVLAFIVSFTVKRRLR